MIQCLLVCKAVPEFEQAYKDLHSEGLQQEVWRKAIDIILAQEAEKAEVFLRRMIRHLYAHNPRFKVIDEDEGEIFNTEAHSIQVDSTYLFLSDEL